MSNRVDHMRGMWHHYNDKHFGGKLTEPTILLKRANRYDGKIQYYEKRGTEDGVRNTDKIEVWIADRCFDDWGLAYATLLHEMIHQYQIQVLGYNAPHDAIFNSIARHLEKLYGYPVR